MTRAILKILLTIAALSTIWSNANSQNLCTVSDTLRTFNGTAIINASVYISRVYLSSVMIERGPRVADISDGNGVVSFQVYRGATCYIQCNYLNFNVTGGAFVTIPNTATALLRNLSPASNDVSTNAGFVRIRETDGSPTLAVTGNNDTLNVPVDWLSNPSTNVYELSPVQTFTLAIRDTVRAADAFGIVKVPSAITITEIAAFTNTGTATFNVEQRAEATPNTAGTDCMTADIVADTDQQEQTSFADATVPANTWLYFAASAVSGGAKKLTLTIKYTVD